MFSLIYAWTKGWVNNGEAGDLRCHSGHYDVTVMTRPQWVKGNLKKTSLSKYTGTPYNKVNVLLICYLVTCPLIRDPNWWEFIIDNTDTHSSAKTVWGCTPGTLSHGIFLENNFFNVFDYVFTYILMPPNMIILYFHSPYFHVSNSVLFLHGTFIFSFYIFTLSIWIILFIAFSKCNQTLRWCHNGCDDVSNHQPHHCLLNHLFRCRSKKASKLRVTGLCVGNSPGIGEFPTQMASNVEKVSISGRHHEF